MADIVVDQVSKSFGSINALKEIRLEIKDQEFVVLLGPSGCGKTTLLRIIAGLETASSGSIRIGGRDVTRLPPRQRRIAMVFQNYAVFPHLTVFENIAFGLRMAKKPDGDVKRQVGRVSQLMHIDHLLERYPAQLSGGQRQRVAVARALAVEPEVLLMDEPLSNLDALLRLEMRTELKKLLQESRTTTIYVTHDQVEAMSLADRIAVMRNGDVEQYDVPMAVYQRPATRFVGSFIGNPPMNFLNVRRGSGQVLIGEAAIAALVDLPSEPVMGVRPEDLSVVTPNSPNAFPAHVMVIEPLGPHLLLSLDVDGQMLRATVPPDLEVKAGATLWLRPHSDRLCWLPRAAA
ncbi:ABC transporter ATP-binding protein [Microvirga lotononidis]|uniref:ATPase component of ABC-type sugar transporter n=1 Tax=Microvirga lotononidis TaxID=864069 RepID=I4YXH7_9HYPH|nr:ABC transporter ATP-binding protein [Microvirga lotononidis]EIM28669.1 ATPase component of ABC-type sugar transporter [Microvirga lotononidis]WQO25590.1 ABC transporter ATP-binding protein [Microvirga lotononidis]